MHYKNNKESKTYVQGLRPFGNTLPRGVKGILKRNGYNYSEIISKWKMLVGEEIANFSNPKSIKMVKGNTNGILIISVKRGNEILIEYSKKEIINKINSYFGYQLINAIKLETINSEIKKIKKNYTLNSHSKKIKEKVNQVKNKNIRDALSLLLDAAKDD